VLVKRIYAQTDAAATRHPEIEFAKAGYLRDHPLVIEAFADRVAEFDQGEPRMNCQMCKYRTRIVGYEADAGRAQEAHHHHVRGGEHSHAHSHAHPEQHERGHPHHHG
jgi:sirohydrochlorin cobaltochelatase